MRLLWIIWKRDLLADTYLPTYLHGIIGENYARG